MDGKYIERFGAAAKAQIAAAGRQTGSSKYYAQKEERGDIRFDSRKEAARYDELLLLLRAGEISELRLQPQFTLQEAYTTAEGVRVRAIRYQADFSYLDKKGSLVVEDVKSPATKTRVYEIKRKLLLRKYGIRIKEV